MDNFPTNADFVHIHLGQALDNEREFHDFPIVHPITDCFVFRREGRRGQAGSKIFTNVPHLTVSRSPPGFEWGYGGGGPYDLSLNILEAVFYELDPDGQRERTGWENYTCFVASRRLCYNFSFVFIDPLPDEGGDIPFEDIVA